MIELHSWKTPNGHKVSIALEELGLDYKYFPINIGNSEQFAPEFLTFSPNNRIPAIRDLDGIDGKITTVFESGAILMYLAEKTGKLLPKSGQERIAVLEWLMWQMGGYGPMLGQAHHFNFYAKDKIDYAMDRYSNEANRLYGVLDRQLEGKTYVAGETYSIADISIFPWSRTYERQNVNIDDYPNVARWRETMLARPAVKRGLLTGQDETSEFHSLDDDGWKKLFGIK